MAARGGGRRKKSEDEDMADEGAAEEEPEVQYYEKPGQKFPTPSPGAGDRVFYETLHKEKPDSAMAMVWLMEHGCWPLEVQRERYDEFVEARTRLREINAKSIPVLESISGSQASAKSGGAKSGGGSRGAAKVIAEPVFDPGMSAGGEEGVGRTTM